MTYLCYYSKISKNLMMNRMFVLCLCRKRVRQKVSDLSHFHKGKNITALAAFTVRRLTTDEHLQKSKQDV